jgi:hypothetical protein
VRWLVTRCLGYCSVYLAHPSADSAIDTDRDLGTDTARNQIYCTPKQTSLHKSSKLLALSAPVRDVKWNLY